MNYRPISLSSCFSKLFESIINRKILSFLERNLLLSDNQFGFRRNRSTADLLSYVTSLWNSHLDKLGESLVVALDISKAFDRVDHSILISKLHLIGLPNNLCSLIGSFLHKRDFSVAIDGASSSSHFISSGVPQGCILSPTLFLIFINDLMSSTKNSLLCFADDSTLHSSFESDKSSISSDVLSNLRVSCMSSVSEDLSSIASWGSTNDVVFNATKSQCLLISRRKGYSPSLDFHDSRIPLTNSVNILGVQISSDLSWSKHLLTVRRNASRRLGILLRCKSFFSPSQRLILYKALVRPSMEYCCHLWAGASKTHLSPLDSIQARAIRFIDDASLSSTLTSLAHRRDVAGLSLMYRYVHASCANNLASMISFSSEPSFTSRSSIDLHPLQLQLPKCRTSHFSNSFLVRFSKNFNSLPKSVFPVDYNLDFFKKSVNRHLLSS